VKIIKEEIYFTVLHILNLPKRNLLRKLLYLMALHSMVDKYR